MKKIILAVVLFLASVSPTFAHPGRTAADGCHYCRTNCDKWGVAWNERHCHGGGSVAPVVTAKPTVKATPLPTKIYTPSPTKLVTATPTKLVTPIPNPTVEPSITPTPTPTIEVTITPTNTPTPTVLAAKTTQKGGIWGWLSRIFGRNK